MVAGTQRQRILFRSFVNVWMDVWTCAGRAFVNSPHVIPKIRHESVVTQNRRKLSKRRKHNKRVERHAGRTTMPCNSTMRTRMASISNCVRVASACTDINNLATASRWALTSATCGGCCCCCFFQRENDCGVGVGAHASVVRQRHMRCEHVHDENERLSGEPVALFWVSFEMQPTVYHEI